MVQIQMKALFVSICLQRRGSASSLVYVALLKDPFEAGTLK